MMCTWHPATRGGILEALVTGGAGFIGSHLCAALLERGYSVTCVDNLSTGARRNIASLLDQPGFSFLDHDVVQPLDRPADVIFHLASPASVPDYLARPLATLHANSSGTLNMLELARRYRARFLFTSTSEIYGDPMVHPQPEIYWGNVNPNGPRSCYDEGKRFGEALTFAYHREYDLDVRLVRIFNTYGPHSRPDDGRIVPNFVTQALAGRPITIYGDGSQTRSYCYVSDMVDGLMGAIFQPGTAGEVFNLGNPDEYTVEEFARRIAALVGSDAGFTHMPLPVDDPTRRCPDITRARDVLGWQPKVDLVTGIQRTIEWFRDLLAVGVEG
ncbi:MAG TPA: UDP-glucuronic acid decarboxylase family protein [Chloroflexota bacterium]|nr:UDP-glucuronic acid decarboxylase family protein [Chloroflexota bacterium]